MKERPILFSGPMVLAILEGRKSQTRRVLKPQPPTGEWDVGRLHAEEIFPTVIDRNGDEQPGTECFGATCDSGEWCLRCPYGAPGDLLWVRETWFSPPRPLDDLLGFAADGDHPHGVTYRKRPSIHMPRWASRLTLRITSVHVERLQEISEEDAVAEGCKEYVDRWWQGLVRLPDGGRSMSEGGADPDGPPPAEYEHPEIQEYRRPAKQEFCALWNSINAKRASWSSNPWVWVISFERVEQQRVAA